MLESIRKGQRWLTLLLVTFVGAVFVFFMGVGGGFGPQRPSGNAVVELGETRAMVSDFQRLRSQQEAMYREQLGDQYDARSMESFLDAQALRTLVETVVLAESARELGMWVSKQEVQRLVRQSPAFRDENGRFDRDRFVDYATYEFGSQRNFLATVREDLLRQKMVGLLYDHALVSEGEARDAALYGLEEVRIAYVAIETRFLPEGESLDDEAVRAWLEANRDALRQRYQDEIDRYSVPEEVWARHILIALDESADQETSDAARERAEAARARLLAGESFAEVAEEVSDDPGSRTTGGDLGRFARGTHAAEIEQAAFALEPGEVSELVRSPAGFHVIRVEERTPASVRSFEEVELELAREAAEKEAAQERASNLAEKLAGRIRQGESLEDAARAESLTLERTGMIRRRPDGFIPGLGGAADVMSAAFALREDAPSSPRIFQVGTRLLLVQLLERHAPGPEEVEAAIAAQSEQLLAAKRNRMVQDYVERRRAELERSGRLRINASLVLDDV